jgi:hypothetical protein
MYHGGHFPGIDSLLSRHSFERGDKLSVLVIAQLENDLSASGSSIPGDAYVVTFDLLKIQQRDESKDGGSKAAAYVAATGDFRDAIHGNGETLTMLDEDDFALREHGFQGVVLLEGKAAALILHRIGRDGGFRFTTESRYR